MTTNWSLGIHETTDLKATGEKQKHPTLGEVMGGEWVKEEKDAVAREASKRVDAQAKTIIQRMYIDGL